MLLKVADELQLALRGSAPLHGFSIFIQLDDALGDQFEMREVGCVCGLNLDRLWINVCWLLSDHRLEELSFIHFLTFVVVRLKINSDF